MEDNDLKQDDEVFFDDDAFINRDEAVEVKVDDDDVPMDEDGDDEDDDQINNNDNNKDDKTSGDTETSEMAESGEALVDMSIHTITSHQSSSVYTVASGSGGNSALGIISGGGDDRAYLHTLIPGNSGTGTGTGTGTATSFNQSTVQTIPLQHAHTDSVSSVAMNSKYVSQDLQKTPLYMAVGSYDGSVAIYDPTKSGDAIGTPIQVLDGPTDVEFVSFHPKGGSVLLAGSISDATVWMYHLPTKKCLQVFVGHECHEEGGGVTAGTFTPDGKFALSIGMDGTLRIWAPRTGVCRHVFKLSSADQNNTGEDMMGTGLTCLAVDGGQDGQLAIAGSENGNAYVVHLQGKKVVGTLRHFDIHQSSRSNNEGMDVEGNGDNEMEILASVEAVGFSSKAHNWVATGGSNGVLKIWDLTHGDGQCRQVCKVGEDGSTGAVTRLNWHPTLPVIVSSYADGIIRLWDARNGQLLHSLSGGDGNAENQINDFTAQFSSVDGGNDIIVTGNDNGTVKVFEMNIGSYLTS